MQPEGFCNLVDVLPILRSVGRFRPLLGRLTACVAVVFWSLFLLSSDYFLHAVLPCVVWLSSFLCVRWCCLGSPPVLLDVLFQ